MRKRWIWICIAAVIALLALDCRPAVRSYAVDAQEIVSPVRIALITDLHSCRYGKNQEKLIAALEKEAPDIVLLGGDIFDDDAADTNAEAFIAGIAGDYPLYYVSGNHEHWAGEAAFAVKMDILERYGVKRLSGSGERLEIRGEEIFICGADDPEAKGEDAFYAQLDMVRASVPEGVYSVLLSHRPEYFEAYCGPGFDLVLCGHAHGGQWRLPGIINGLYAPNQGLFPEYAGGKYDAGETAMIVSRGLARESTRIPRIFNRPEIVMVELG